MAHPPDLSALLPESVDNILRVRDIHQGDINGASIANIEVQQAIINAILKTLQKTHLETNDVIRVFEQILGIDIVIDEFPKEFFVLLSKEEILRNILKYCGKRYVREYRIQQLCYCVLVKILESCNVRNIQFFLDVLFRKEVIHSKITYTLTIYLEKCKKLKSSSSAEQQKYYSSIAIIFRFMVLAYGKLQVASVQTEISDRLLNITYSCLVECQNEEDVVEYGIKLLTSFMSEDSNKCLLFLRGGNYRVIFHAVSQNPLEDGVVDSAIALLMVLFGQSTASAFPEEDDRLIGDDTLEEVFREDDESKGIYNRASIFYFISEAVVFTFEKLDFYEDRPVIVLKFLDMVEKISTYPEIAENLINHSAINSLLELMNCHCKDSMVLTRVISIVDKLQRLSSETNEDSIDSRWLAEVFSAMVNHQDNAQLQEAACRALTNRIKANPSLVNLIGEGDDHILPLHMTVLAALNIHSSDIYVFQAACGAIYEMAIHSKTLRKLLYTKGASSSIIKEMKINKGEVEVHGFGCRALRSLAFNNPFQEELLVIEDVLTLLNENMRSFDDVNVLKECIGLLACMATDLPLVLRQSMNLKMPELVMKIALDNVHSPELVEIALEAIALFTSAEEHQLLHLQHIKNLRYILLANESHERVQIKGCVILQLINANVEFVSNIFVAFEVINIIRDVMNRLDNNRKAQIEGCVALYLLFFHNNESMVEVKSQAIEWNVQELLFGIIEDSNDDDEIAIYARQGLLELTTEQSRKDLVLQKACYGNHTKCAKFMIERGASLEARPNSPLCIAVNNRNLELVEVLLTCNRTDADKALATCLENELYEIAGVLLRHIGFELDSITWGALNLKELKPELFYHTLTYKVGGKKITNIPILPQSERKRKSGVARQRSVSFYDTPPTGSTSPLSGSPENIPYLRQRSSSESDIDQDNLVGRKIRIMSGPFLPYNRNDPRLDRPPNDESHVIIQCPIDDIYYPGQPNAEMLSTGKLFHSVDRCGVPMPRTRSMLRKSFTAISIASGISDITNYTDVAPRAKICKLNSSESRNISCLSPTTEIFEPIIDIKQLDISHNKLSDLDALLTCPSNLISRLTAHLETLIMNNNQLVDFKDIYSAALPHLKILDLANNQLQRFPSEIFKHSVLENLVLSNNLISGIEGTVPVTVSLVKLDLSSNKFREFPGWIGEAFPRLNKLLMRKNHVREIPNQISGFRNIKEVNLSHNHITRVSNAFFRNCVSLEKINLSRNNLDSLPQYTPNTLSRLTELKLSHNQLKDRRPFHVPQLILSIPSLILVDLSHNRITHLPDPQLWSSRVLREINLSHNRVGEITMTGNVKLCWPCIQKLNFAHNKIKVIPKEIGLLNTLNSLDFSDNNISILPDEIGLLNRLYDLPLDGLNLQHDPAALKGGPKDIVSYFRCKLKKAVPYHRIKLMLVGLGGRGKTSLMFRFSSRKRPSNLATNGICINNWELRPPNRSKQISEKKEKPPTFIMNTWDFAGQEEFYSTHQYFLTSRALYVAVYDASKGRDELNGLTTWLLNIQAAAPGAMVILVGTHADKIPKERYKAHVDELSSYINEFVSEPGFPKIQAQAIVNCLKDTDAMEKLREQIYDIICNFTYEGQPIINQYVPQSYVDLEDLIQTEARKMSEEKLLPIKKWEQLVMLSAEKGIALDKEELLRALKFLKETGSIMHFTDPAGNFNNLFFIDPQWLCDMMARVVTLKEINRWITPQGVLTKTNALQLFPSDIYSPEFLDRYFRLLRKFEIVFPLSKEEYLITARVPDQAPEYISALRFDLMDSDAIMRRYVFPYTPSGFWARLITRILLYVRERPIENDALICEYWQDGIYIYWDEMRYFLITAVPEPKNTFDIFVPVNQTGFKLLGNVVDLVDNLLEEWYPGLNDTEYASLSTKILRLSPCDYCKRSGDPYYFTIEECISASNESYMIECESCGVRSLRLIAPDVVFADIDPKLIQEQVVIQDNHSKHLRLGQGAFADVYKAQVNGTNLAVKVFRDNYGANPNRLLRQEVDILTRLHHPCLISLVGVSLRPRMLLLEHAPLGNLEETLQSGRGLSRGMQHRIALQIAEGLVYLHDRNIVYRDLKPGNVLVFSLSMGMFINVKLSDYGISQWSSSMMGLKSGKGTLGYQAPEVIQKGVEYNSEVDIFSYGVTFYEIITGGAHPYGDVSFLAQLDAAVLSNRPMDSLSKHKSPPWPDIENLIQECLSPNPELRPNAKQIREALLDEEIVCLKREVAISKEQSIECTTVRGFVEDGSEKLEVWVGSGDSGTHSQISWFTLGETKKKSVQGMIVGGGRILCMVSYDKYIIVGTNKSALIVFDAELKERKHTIYLQDSVLCMKVLPGSRLVVGLANGSMLVYPVNRFVNGDCDHTPINIDTDITPFTIACLTITGNRILCGYGTHVLEMRMETFAQTRHWAVGEKANNTVSEIVLSKQHIIVSCKESHQIMAYENDKVFQEGTRIDCYEILRARVNEVTPRDCRVVSMAIVDRSTLWIGCGKGNILIIDAINLTGAPLAVIGRNKSSIRSIAVTPRSYGGSTYVVTTGQGFKQWNGKDDIANDGYVLVWDADLPKQKKTMLIEHQKRNELAAQMASV